MSLESGRKDRLVQNITWNLTGRLVPLASAIFAMPVLIHSLEVERVGVLAIIWMLVGYFSLFDMGLGRALTYHISARLGGNKSGNLDEIIWTGLAMITALGVIGSMVLWLLRGWLVSDVLSLSGPLAIEAFDSLSLISWALPFVLASTAIIAVLQAFGAFGRINLVRVPLGSLMFLAPAAISQFTANLAMSVVALLVLRIAGVVAYGLVMITTIAPEARRPKLNAKLAIPLMQFGGWMTISNVIGPVMTYMDRFFVGAVLSISAVTFYVTPYDLITKATIFASSTVAVLFPLFAETKSDNGKAMSSLLDHGTRFISFVLLPVLFGTILFARDGLLLWLDVRFATQSTLVLQILVIGVYANSLALVPHAYIQGSGKPRLIAFLHLAELPFYLMILVWLTEQLGIVGTALAWTLRTSLDAAALFFMAKRSSQRGYGVAWRRVALIISLLLIATALLAVEQLWRPSGELKALILLGTLPLGFLLVSRNELARLTRQLWS